jgi:hypothetical protein
MNRENHVHVRLTDDELALIDEKRGALSRSAHVRSLLRTVEPPRTAASYEEALELLTGLARDGNAQAAIALERALRGAGHEVDDALERILAR